MDIIKTVVDAIEARKSEIGWGNLTWDEQLILNEKTFLDGFNDFLQSPHADQYVMAKVVVKNAAESKTKFLCECCEKYQNGIVIFSNK